MLNNKKINDSEVISLGILSSFKTLRHNITGRNYMPNRNTLISNKINTFEPTPVQIDGRNQLIKNIEIIDRGSGYTGEESVIVDGEKPANWNNNIGCL